MCKAIFGSRPKLYENFCAKKMNKGATGSQIRSIKIQSRLEYNFGS